MDRYQRQIGIIIGLISWIMLSVNAQSPIRLYDPMPYHAGIFLQAVIDQSTANPSWNFIDDSVTSVKYSFQTLSTNGNFRRAMDPNGISDNYWTASGSKYLGEKSLFYGSFSYRLKNDKDKMWAQNRQPYTSLPFILADSSTGDWELNGLMWNVDISRELIRDKLYSGLSIFYNVDERYQDIFPRPRANHRDMFVNTGIGYIKDEKSRIGTMVKYYNIQESLTTSKYSLDQEKTPIFYKFRGLDTPLIFRGETSEERLYSIEGASLMIDGLVKHFDLADIDFSVNYGISHADNVDGGAYPIKQGKWRNQYGSYSLTLLFALGNTNCLKLFSNGFTRNLDAEHPDLHLDIYSEKEKIFNGGVTLDMGRQHGWMLSPTAEFLSRSFKRVDTFNGILDYFPGRLGRFYLKMDIPDRGFTDFNLGVGFDKYRVGDDKVYIPRNVGFFYQNVTMTDESYYSSDYSAFRISEQLSFGKKRRYLLVLDYLRIMPDSDMFNYREQLQLSLIVEDMMRKSR